VTGCSICADEKLGTSKREVGWVSGFGYRVCPTSLTSVRLVLLKVGYKTSGGPVMTSSYSDICRPPTNTFLRLYGMTDISENVKGGHS